MSMVGGTVLTILAASIYLVSCVPAPLDTININFNLNESSKGSVSSSTNGPYDNLLFNGVPLPLVYIKSRTLTVSGGNGKPHNVKVFAIGGGAGGNMGGGGSGFIATGSIRVQAGENLQVTVGANGGHHSEVRGVRADGAPPPQGVGGSGYSGGGGMSAFDGDFQGAGDGGSDGSDGEAGTGEYGKPGGAGQGFKVPEITTPWGKLLPGRGGLQEFDVQGYNHAGGGGGGVTFYREAPIWKSHTGEGYGAGGGYNEPGNSGLVILY